MATLHVRNVPDPLYEALRACAEQNGRSIGAQAIALLNESLSTGRRGFPFFGLPARGPATPMQAFGDTARAAIVAAQAFAREFGHETVGGDDLLLGLLASPGSQAAEALAAPPFGLALDAVRPRVERGPGTPPGPVSFGAEAKRALELALREALQFRSATIEPEHVVLGLAGAGGVAADLIRSFGLTPGSLRTALLTSVLRMPSVPQFRVVELEGSAEEWEAQLSDAASGPYELVEIVGTRAIFQLRRRP